MSTSSSIPKCDIKHGSIICDWKVIRKIGSGGFGTVYEVEKDGIRGALKTEIVDQTGKRRETLTNEVKQLRVMQWSDHFCRLYLACRLHYGKETVNIMIMILMERSLSRLRRMTPERRFTRSTAVRLSRQCLELNLNDQGNIKHRSPRKRVAFFGTDNYCSLNMHRRLDQGRRDDLWSWLYMTVEFMAGSLIWHNDDVKVIERKKEKIGSRLLLKCPQEMFTVYDHIRFLEYNSKPNYILLQRQLNRICARLGCSEDQPYDWEDGGYYHHYYVKKSDTEKELSDGQKELKHV
ncbi:hypothetical protein KIN20_022811 [Parelaphostrongylus tenuis]|uniref:Protein kinase domain-containing protein n=1 Tax=Parelaphostrongylus tenuis TaxID=148309 RepID=A0AAD5MUM6_PARTN|nr:hypothetical protein KIN20_022811 [Parelaphostrongylus tenuis]